MKHFKNSPPRSKARGKGFTLPELLVAMSITLVLVMLTLTITGTAMDAWRGARTEIRAAGQAKIMLNALGRDLEAMVSRRGNNQNQWLVATTNPAPLGPGSAPSPNASRLTFYTRAADRYGGNAGSRQRLGGDNGGDRNADLGGDISAVSYELDFVDPVWGSQNQTFSTFVLYRNLMSPRQTYDTVLGAQNLEQTFEAQAGPNDLTDLICENIYDFTVTFVVTYRDATGQILTERMPVMSTQQGGDEVKRSFGILGSGLAPNLRPGSVVASGQISSVELSITVLSDEAISLLKRIPFRSQAEKQQFLEKHSYRYTRSVIIPQG